MIQAGKEASYYKGIYHHDEYRAIRVKVRNSKAFGLSVRSNPEGYCYFKPDSQ
jgi:hypothetical protein